MPYFRHQQMNIYYEVAGHGPALLLINGLSMDTRLWQPLIDRLKASFEILCYDMRCAGHSDKPAAPFTISDLADEAHALMHHVGFEKSFVLGFSMGGMTAMSLALKYPADVLRMFLVSTAPSFKRPHPPSEETMTMLHRTDVSPALLTQVYESIHGSKYRERVSAEDFINFRMTDENPQAAVDYLNQLRAAESCDLCDEPGKISAPAVVIVGDEDRLIPPENSYWLDGHLKDSKLCVLKGIGHMVPIEAPDQLAEVLISNSLARNRSDAR